MVKTLSNDFMQKIATEEAWKELSGDFQWNESLLEKYQDKVDWHEVSENTNILWTIPMVQKFKNRIDWDSSPDMQKKKLSQRFSSRLLRTNGTGQSCPRTATLN